jgi:hypothetical protein
MTEKSQTQRTLADQLTKLRPDIKIKAPNDKPADSQEAVSAVQEEEITKADQQLKDFFDQENVAHIENDAVHEVIISAIAREVAQNLQENSGKHLKLANTVGKEVEVWYDENANDGKGKFFRRFPDGGISSFPERRLGVFLDNNGFKPMMNLVKNRSQKVTFDLDGNHIKPLKPIIEQEKIEHISPVTENINKVTIPANDFKVNEASLRKEPSEKIVFTDESKKDVEEKNDAKEIKTEEAEEKKGVVKQVVKEKEEDIIVAKQETQETADPFEAFEERLRKSKAFRGSPHVADAKMAFINDVRTGSKTLEQLKRELLYQRSLYTTVEKLILAERETKKDQTVTEPIKGKNVLKDKIFEKDFDEKKAQEVQEDKQEKIELDPRLFPVELSAEKQQLIDEQQEKIEMLRESMAVARKDYAQMDYKKTNAWDNMKRFFGQTLSKDEDLDVIEMQARYQNAVMDYTNARLEMARTESASQEELKHSLVEVLKEVEIQERVHLYDARVNAKMPNWLVEKTQKTVDWYRGLSFKERIAFSAVLIAGGVVAGATFGAGAASAAFLARRAFGGAVAGRGVFQFGETIAQKSSQKEMDANIRDVQKEMAFTENSDDMVRQLQERLNTSIGTVDTKLNDMMKNRTRSTVAGFAVGSFLSFGAPQYLMEKFQAGSAIDVSPTATPLAPVEHIATTPDAPIAETIIDHMEKPVELVIQQGTHQSIEGQIIKHLIENGIDKTEAGSMAHRMLAVDYMHHLKETGGKVIDFDRILSGKITLSPDSMHIESIEATPMRAMAEHASSVHSKVMESVARVASHAKEEATSFSQPPTDVFGYPAQSTPTDVFGHSEIIATPVVSLEHVAPTTETANLFRLAVAKGLMGELSEGKQRIWSEIKNMTIAQIQADQSGKYAKTLAVMMKHTKELGSSMPKIRPDQTLLKWAAEVAKVPKQ